MSALMSTRMKVRLCDACAKHLRWCHSDRFFGWIHWTFCARGVIFCFIAARSKEKTMRETGGGRNKLALNQVRRIGEIRVQTPHTSRSIPAMPQVDGFESIMQDRIYRRIKSAGRALPLLVLEERSDIFTRG
jgi:hypothetical protein